jgi:hypothetical protein
MSSRASAQSLKLPVGHPSYQPSFPSPLYLPTQTNAPSSSQRSAANKADKVRASATSASQNSASARTPSKPIYAITRDSSRGKMQTQSVEPKISKQTEPKTRHSSTKVPPTHNEDSDAAFCIFDIELEVNVNATDIENTKLPTLKRSSTSRTLAADEGKSAHSAKSPLSSRAAPISPAKAEKQPLKISPNTEMVKAIEVAFDVKIYEEETSRKKVNNQGSVPRVKLNYPAHRPVCLLRRNIKPLPLPRNNSFP